jgi:inner membrane protein
MPSPIGHAIAGYAVVSGSKETLSRRVWISVAGAMFLANLPDVDFIPGLLLGDPGEYHRQAFHSLFAAVLVGASIASVYRMRGRGFVGSFLLTAGLFSSHLLLDLFTHDTTGDAGLQLFWPFTERFFSIPLPLFSELHKSGTGWEFVTSLLVLRNLPMVLWEITVVLPFVLLALWWRWSRRARRG